MNKKETRNLGIILGVIFILLSFYNIRNTEILLTIGLSFVVVGFICPILLQPLSNLINILRKLILDFLLLIIFLLIITPFGVIFSVITGDSLQIKKFKKGKSSVFINRDHTFTHKDLISPY